MSWTLGLVALGCLIYRPWEPIPFDITDFSEILPLLNETRGIWGRLQALITYFGGHGRINILSSTLMWSNWEIFGLWAPGWRLFRVLLLGVLIWAFLRTALSFGVKPLWSGLGASLFVLGRPASEGWLRLTGEPIAAVFFLLALGVALHYHRSNSPARTSLLIGTLGVLMILAKETMISCMPLLWLLAVTWQGESGIRIPKLNRHTLTATAILGTTTVALGSLMLLVSSQSGPEAYTGAYGTGGLDLVRLQYNVLATVWPLGEPFQIFSIFGASSTLFVILGCGLAVRQGPRAPVLGGILFLLLISLSGPLVYLPWQRFEAFYAIPFLVGPAGLLALAARGLTGTSKVRATLVMGAVALLLVQPALDADRERDVRAITKVLNWEVARAVADVPNADSLLFAVPILPDQAWQGRGPAITRYANVIFQMGKVIPAADELCADEGEHLGETPNEVEIIVSYHHWCGPIPGADKTIAQEFRSFHLRPPRVRRSRTSADILVRAPVIQ